MRQVVFYSNLIKVGKTFNFNRVRHSDSFNLEDFKESFYRLTNSKLVSELDLMPERQEELIGTYGSVPKYYSFKTIKGAVGFIAVWITVK